MRASLKQQLLGDSAIRKLLAFELSAHDRLLGATTHEARRALYSEVYAEWPALVQPLARALSSGEEPGSLGYAPIYLQWFRPWLEGAAVLEVGCGAGHSTRAIAAFAKEVVGIDVSETLIHRAQSEPAPRTTFLKADATSRLPFSDGQFDSIYWNDVAEHLHPDDLRNALRELVRVLRPGGALCTITCHSFDGPHDASMLIQPPGAPPLGVHLQEFTYRSWSSHLQAAGLVSSIPRIGMSVQNKLRLAGKSKQSFGQFGTPAVAELFASASRFLLTRWGLGTNVVCSVATRPHTTP